MGSSIRTGVLNKKETFRSEHWLKHKKQYRRTDILFSSNCKKSTHYFITKNGNTIYRRMPIEPRKNHLLARIH